MREEYPEKRRFPRMAAKVPVHVKRLGAHALEGPATATVVGLGGCMVEVTEPFGQGSAVELMIDVGGNFITARGRVLYEIPTGDGRYDLGVEFTHLAPAHLRVLQTLFDQPG